jgi:hypothetical protein
LRVFRSKAATWDVVGGVALGPSVAALPEGVEDALDDDDADAGDPEAEGLDDVGGATEAEGDVGSAEAGSVPNPSVYTTAVTSPT